MIFELTFLCLVQSCLVSKEMGSLYANKADCDAIAEYLSDDRMKGICIEAPPRKQICDPGSLNLGSSWECLYDSDLSRARICRIQGKSFPPRQDGKCYSEDAK